VVYVLFQFIKKNTVSEMIIAQINDKVLSGELRPGDKLPAERVLAEQLQVSRSSLREALRVLQFMGILDIRPGEGLFLGSNSNMLSDHFLVSHLIKQFSAIEIYEARKFIEVDIVELAANRILQEEETLLEDAYRRLVEVQNDEALFLDANLKFHETIAAISKNDVLTEVISAIWKLTFETKLMENLFSTDDTAQRSNEGHKKIMEAIIARDSVRAKKEIVEHLDVVEGIIRKNIMSSA